MKTALVVGLSKTGTTIVSSVIQKAIPGALLGMEPKNVAFFERYGTVDVPHVVKILYEHWMQRPFLLTGILRGETGFRPDKRVAIVRDPRDGLISALMYAVYDQVLRGAKKEQVEAWVEVVRGKEADPEKYSVFSLIENLGRIFCMGLTPNWFFENFVSYTAWIADNRDYLHLMRYEDFAAGKTAELSAYLGHELPESREVDPSFRRVARTRGSGDWRRMMLPQDVTYWRERYGSALEAHGYGDWTIRSERSDPAMGSEYILRIADEGFRTAHPEPPRSMYQSWNFGGQVTRGGDSK